MDFFFVDDASQPRPSRNGMGSLLAVGGIQIPEDILKNIDRDIHSICSDAGFPPNEPFKWSPGRELWMWGNLRGKNREEFYLSVLSKLHDYSIIAWVIIEDTKYNTATSATRHDMDVTQMFLERIHFTLGNKQCNGIVIVSQPGGDIDTENAFLTECTDILKEGTTFTQFDRIAQVFSLNHRFSRLLQVADLITSCTTAYISGEDRFAPVVFGGVKPLLDKDRGRIGGIGVKLHPDIQYVNLYHWLLGDTMFIRKNVGLGMPLPNHPYNKSAIEP